MDKIVRRHMRKGYCCIFAFIFCYSCSCSDYGDNLGDGYFFRFEAGDLKDILCEIPNGGEIPANVFSYDYNRQFIIAKQKPLLPPDPLYDKEYLYPLGVATVYYWIIIQKEHVVLGPMSLDAFNDAKVKCHVPNDLKLD